MAREFVALLPSRKPLQALKMWLKIAPDLAANTPHAAKLKEIAVRMTLDVLKPA